MIGGYFGAAFPFHMTLNIFHRRRKTSESQSFSATIGEQPPGRYFRSCPLEQSCGTGRSYDFHHCLSWSSPACCLAGVHDAVINEFVEPDKRRVDNARRAAAMRAKKGRMAEKAMGNRALAVRAGRAE